MAGLMGGFKLAAGSTGLNLGVSPVGPRSFVGRTHPGGNLVEVVRNLVLPSGERNAEGAVTLGFTPQNAFVLNACRAAERPCSVARRVGSCCFRASRAACRDARAAALGRVVRRDRRVGHGNSAEHADRRATHGTARRRYAPAAERRHLPARAGRARYAFGCPDNLECMRVRKGADVTARSVSGALGAGGMVARFSDLGVWGASGVVCMLCGRCGSSCAALLDRARETKEVTAGTS